MLLHVRIQNPSTRHYLDTNTSSIPPPQSYEELFLWKLGCEELHLPPIALRTLDFKEAAQEIEAQYGPALTRDGAKLALRAFAKCHSREHGDVEAAQAQPASPANLPAPAPGCCGESTALLSEPVHAGPETPEAYEVNSEDRRR